MSRTGLLLLTASVLMLAQGPAVIRIDVSLVQVDAVVTDSKNKHISNLKAEDFEILQDGKPQAITNLSYIVPAVPPAPASVPAPVQRAGVVPPPPPPSALKPAEVRRMLALVVDDLALSFESMAHVRDALRKFVNHDMQPGDMVAIIRTSAGMGVLQQFTTDRSLLNAAIDHVKFTIGRVGVFSFDPVTSPGPFPPVSHPDVDSAFDQLRNDTFLAGTLGAIRYVIDGLHDMPGRKSIVLFSESLQLFPGVAQDPVSIATAPSGSDPAVLENLRRLIDRANRASVVIYTIDPRGLQSFQPTAADSVSSVPNPAGGRGITLAALRDSQVFDSQQGLSMLALDTGGLFIKNNNFIDSALEDAVADTEGYYLIGYHPDSATFDSKAGQPLYHKVQVHLKVTGLRVRSRSGFFGESDTEAREVPLTGRTALMHALTSPFSSGDLHVRLTTLFNQMPDARSCLSALLHIDAHDLSFTPQPDGSQQAAIEVAAMTFGISGQPVDQSDRTFHLDLKPDQYAAAMLKGLVYAVNQPVQRPGVYQMRIALRDQSSDRLGSANQFVEVPDLNKGSLTLSSILLRHARGANSGVDQVEGQVADTDPATAAALRVFKPGDALTYQYLVFNALTDAAKRPELAVQTRIYREGKPVYAGQPMLPDVARAADSKRLLAGGHLMLANGIPAGDYILQVIVTDKLAKQKYQAASQWIDFEVRK